MLLTASTNLSNKDLHMKILNGDHLIMLLSNRVSVGRFMLCMKGLVTFPPVPIIRVEGVPYTCITVSDLSGTVTVDRKLRAH